MHAVYVRLYACYVYACFVRVFCMCILHARFVRVVRARALDWRRDASATFETRSRMAEIAAINVLAALRGARPPNLINALIQA